MTEEIKNYLILHRKSLNLAEISRLAGLEESYAKKVAQGGFTPSEKAAEQIADVLEVIVSDFPRPREARTS